MGEHDASRSRGMERPTATEMNEAIAIPETVTPEGLRVRAKLVRESVGDESCARHLELAADEIARLKAKRPRDDPSLEATAYGTATAKSEREMKLILLKGEKVLGYLIFPCEKVYDFGTHILSLYDELEGL